MKIILTGLSVADNFLQLFGVTVLFLVVLVITYFTTRIVGGIKMGALKESNFKVIDTYKISQNKFLQLIQVGKRYFVIAVGKDSIQLITELQKDEITIKSGNTGQANSFQDILNALKRQNGKEEKKDDFIAGQLISSEDEDEPEEMNRH